MSHELPEGVVTFLFTDVVGSTRLFEEVPGPMLEALRQHDDAIEEAVREHGGIPVRPRGEGDSRFVVFADAHDAVAGAAAMQRRLQSVHWVTPAPLQVRAALHTGFSDLRHGDYYGSAVNRAARLRGIAHGGQILMSGATWELVQDRVPDRVAVRDLGEHGLRDLARRERVFQITPAGLRDTYPPLTSLYAVPNNLPDHLTEFVGREAERSDIRRLLGGTRLLTILGPGGSGKTRLAIQVAGEISSDYQDGVFFVGLAELTSSDDVARTVAEELGVDVSGSSDVQDQLLAYMTARRMLLLLDNLEHLDGAASVIAETLKKAPNVTIVATSRSRLKLSGESVLPLAGLKTTWDEPEDALQASGAELFQQTALRADPSFAIGTDDLGALGEILRLTGGMPLGIMLAASWVDMLPIGEIASEIGRSVDFLETEMEDVPPRQRSVRAVFDSTWALLTETERDVYSRLAVFHGGFTRDAAKAVAGADLRVLKRLADKSLLQREEVGERYQMHKLLRQYAVERMRGSQSGAEAGLAHMRYYTELMERAAGRIGSHEQLEALNQIESDFENVRAAWIVAVETQDADAVDRSLEALYWFCSMRARVPTGESLLRRAREQFAISLDEESHPVQRRLILRFDNQGQARWNEIDRALAIAREKGTQSETAFFLWMLGVNRYASKDFGRAVTALDEAHSLFRQKGDDFYRVETRHLLGLCQRFLGRLEDASALEEEVEEVSRRTGNRFALGRSLGRRGLFTVLESHDPKAKDVLREAIAIREELGDDAGVAVSLVSLAVDAFYRGDLATSRRFAEDGRQRATASNSLFPLTFALSVLGWLAAVEEDYAEALALSRKSLDLAPDPNVEFAPTLGVAMAACGLEDYGSAREHLAAALGSRSPFHTEKGLATCLPVIAAVHASQEQSERASEVLGLAFTHPMSATAWMEQWPLVERLRAELKDALGDDEFDAAWRRGAHLELADVAGAVATAR